MPAVSLCQLLFPVICEHRASQCRGAELSKMSSKIPGLKDETKRIPWGPSAAVITDLMGGFTDCCGWWLLGV